MGRRTRKSKLLKNFLLNSLLNCFSSFFNTLFLLVTAKFIAIIYSSIFTIRFNSVFETYVVNVWCKLTYFSVIPPILVQLITLYQLSVLIIGKKPVMEPASTDFLKDIFQEISSIFKKSDFKNAFRLLCQTDTKCCKYEFRSLYLTISTDFFSIVFHFSFF